MKSYVLHALLCIILFTIGLWLLIVIITDKGLNLTQNRLEVILGALTAIAIALFLLWIAHCKQMTNRERDSSRNNSN